MQLEPEKFIRTQSDLRRILASREAVRIQTINLDHLRLLHEDDEFQRATFSATFFTADGWPVVALIRRRGVAVRRVTGSQAVADICDSTDFAGMRWALYGGSEEMGSRFGEVLKSVGQELVIHAFDKKENWDAAAEAIRCSDAAVHGVLIAVSQPFGEIFAARISERSCGALKVIGVGGGVEMQVGLQRRASVLSRRLGMEWLARLRADPSRLFHRYIVKDVPFFFRNVLPYLVRVK